MQFRDISVTPSKLKSKIRTRLLLTLNQLGTIGPCANVEHRVERDLGVRGLGFVRFGTRFWVPNRRSSAGLKVFRAPPAIKSKFGTPQRVVQPPYTQRSLICFV